MKIDDGEYTTMSIYDEYGKVDNPMILILAKSGAGKSLASESILEEYHDAGYIIISLTDVKSEFEICYSMFQPKEKYHLNGLKKIGKQPSTKQIKIYHPFTFNLPTKLPKITPFTIPLKNLNRDRIKFIAETELETDTILLLNNAIQSLTNKDSIYDLMHYIQKISKTKRKKMYGKDITQYDSESFFLEASQKGTITNVSEIVSWLKPYLTDYFLTPNDYKLNLDVKKIFADQKSYHCLSTNWIKDPKIKYFAILNFFDEIMQNVLKSPKPICFLIEEIAYLAQFRAEGYKKQLAQYFRNNLLTMRGKGKGCTSIMTTQVWFDVDENIREKATEVFIGNLRGFSDFERVCKALNYGTRQKNIIRSLPKNTYIRVGQEETPIIMFFPSHCHAESNYSFIEMYKKIHPLQDYKEIIEETKQHLKEIQIKWKDIAKKQTQQKIKEAQEEFERQNKSSKTQEELTKLKEEKKKNIQLSKTEKIIKCHQIKTENPQATLKEIADTIGISKATAMRYLKIPLPQKNTDPLS